MRGRQLAGFYPQGQLVLLGRQRTSGIRRDRARWILRLVEIELDLPAARQFRIQKAARSVGFLAGSLVPKDKEELLVFDYRFKPQLMAFQREHHVARAGKLKRAAQDIGDGHQFRLFVRDEARLHTILLACGEPPLASEIGAQLTVLILEADGVAPAALNHAEG